MSTNSDWKSRSKCLTLTPKEADKLFFPGSGGKPHKADRFCSNCPVRSLCLQESIDGKYRGFFAGTTDDERDRHTRINMARRKELAELIPNPEADEGKRKIYRSLASEFGDHDWLDLQGPTEEELGLTPVGMLVKQVVSTDPVVSPLARNKRKAVLNFRIQ